MNVAARAAEKIRGHDKVSTESTQPKVDPNRKMKALVWKGAKDVSIEEVPRPVITHPQDIILKVTATTICGSDLHLYTNDMPDMHKGDILGHEFLGIVEDVGSEVKELSVGKRVVVAFDIVDGVCEYCKREEYTACETTNSSRLMKDMYGQALTGVYGYSHLTGGYPGGQAQYVRVPFADFNCLPVPDSVPDMKALFLSDVVCTSFHGTEVTNVSEGDVVGIWGLGPIGLLAARWCQIRGAKRIIGIDCVPERLQIAERVLGIETINFKKSDTLKTLKEICPRGLDVGIECAGFRYSKSWTHSVERALKLETDTADILTECIMAVRMFGRLGIVGDYVGYANHFPIGALMEKAIRVQGGQCPVQKYWKKCLKYIESGEFDPTFIVTHTLKIEDMPKAYKQFHNKEDGMIKVFIEPF